MHLPQDGSVVKDNNEQQCFCKLNDVAQSFKAIYHDNTLM